MPGRLIAVASLCCLVGGFAFVDTIRDSISSGGFILNVAVCLLPVGIGLFRRKPSSRRWAAFWAGLTMAFMIGVSIVVLYFEGGFVWPSVFGFTLRGADATAFGWTVTIVTILICVLTIWVLYTPPVSALFVKSAGGRNSESESSSPDDPPVLPV